MHFSHEVLVSGIRRQAAVGGTMLLVSRKEQIAPLAGGVQNSTAVSGNSQAERIEWPLKEPKHPHGGGTPIKSRLPASYVVVDGIGIGIALEELFGRKPGPFPCSARSGTKTTIRTGEPGSNCAVTSAGNFTVSSPTT